jgi:hypothetical protein
MLGMKLKPPRQKTQSTELQAVDPVRETPRSIRFFSIRFVVRKVSDNHSLPPGGPDLAPSILSRRRSGFLLSRNDDRNDSVKDGCSLQRTYPPWKRTKQSEPDTEVRFVGVGDVDPGADARAEC